MKKMIMFVILCFAATTSVFGAEVTRGPVTRVVEMCGGNAYEMNVSALENAAGILKSSHPELSAELMKIIETSVG